MTAYRKYELMEVNSNVPLFHSSLETTNMVEPIEVHSNQLQTRYTIEIVCTNLYSIV